MIDQIKLLLHCWDEVNDIKRYKVRDFINDQQLNFNLGNVIKYVCREADKGGTEDLKKAVQYLEFEIERRQKDD